ncbi:MAG: hypothetical protein ABMB14_22145 [Myxococcota bacterium]
MRVSLADWRRPIDAAYCFRLRPVGDGGFTPAVPALGVPRDIRVVVTEALVDGDGARFDVRVDRWAGPEDRDADGGQPYVGAQRWFEERPWQDRLSSVDLDAVLRGTVRVMRRPDDAQVDYVLRDHHLLDVVLYHYRATGALPTALFHADRHSDWCTDGYLAARRPAQAATWWALLEGLKRPGTDDPVLAERAVTFTTASAGAGDGRDVGASTRVPWWVEPGELGWPEALPKALDADWVSLDLDYLQPRAQLALTRGLLRDQRFHALMRTATVRVFVLSPQFAKGGDRVRDWTVGDRSASLRMVNLVRGMRIRPGPP